MQEWAGIHKTSVYVPACQQAFQTPWVLVKEFDLEVGRDEMLTNSLEDLIHGNLQSTSSIVAESRLELTVKLINSVDLWKSSTNVGIAGKYIFEVKGENTPLSFNFKFQISKMIEPTHRLSTQL